MQDTQDSPPLVVHLIHRLAIGGLENSLVNLLNTMPRDRYRHAVVCLAGYTDFRDRLRRPDVQVLSLDKREGKDWPAYFRLWRLLRRLRPAILHTRTLGALDGQIYGALAGVPARVHGEHGIQIDDLEGRNPRHRRLRRLCRPLVHRYITVSRNLAEYLTGMVGVAPDRVTQIYNGVDARRFDRHDGPRMPVGPDGFMDDRSIVIGTVGRMQPVKDQLTLVRAFLALLDGSPAAGRLRLLMVGDGPLRAEAQRLLKVNGAAGLAWLPGERSDIPDLLRAMDVFAMPSLGEGVSNTILEAMASSLPVVATRVGGNPELVEDGVTGMLVPSADPASMAAALRTYLDEPRKLRAHGGAGRRSVEERFSMQAMVRAYLEVYDGVCPTVAHA